MANVALVKGVVRYDIIFKSLELIQEDVINKVSSSKRIVIKPDLLHLNGCSELTNADSVKAVLDFIEEFTNKKITIAEGSFSDEDVFHRHNYHDLLKDYSVKFLNLNNDDSAPIKLGKTTINISKTLLESDFRISVAVLKRDRTSLLGAIPNMVIGSVSENDKTDFYKSKTFLRNTSEIFKLIRPGLSVIDGFDSVKTNLKTSLAIASKDAVSADTVASKILKTKRSYLGYCKKSKIKMVGSKLSEL
ncbi:hypothetical protein CMO88_05180 [Candidatus Woesearchaeota archaeon]|nr:hypothetical protein [Candidatus Woesearchaeota archaeon]|tara:strand:+ start:1839 stop:2579 length:741 start_codon:yes stop_codon:yes gene_type:complete